MDNIKLILCSKSPRRIELIRKLKYPFIVYPVKINENIGIKNPVKLVKKLALEKALMGVKNFDNGIAIGVDTVVVYNKEIIGKPKNINNAKTILKKLSGTVHKVYTGVALIDCCSGKKIVDYEVTKVKMRKLTDIEINVFAKKHIDKAGSYAVQEKNDAVVTKIYGDYYNVVGFPIKKIKKMLRQLIKKL